jgi:hypothetical protein
MSPCGTLFSDLGILFDFLAFLFSKWAANSLPGPYEVAESITGKAKTKGNV